MNPTVVVGGQAGSEGKGAVCARLHKERPYVFAVRIGGPNAGHTVIGDDGKKYALRQIPVAAVADPGCQLVIAAGSEIDLAVLYKEIETLEKDGYSVKERLLIDEEATVVEDRHQQTERIIATGTTGKGIGAARADRAVRRARRMADIKPVDLHCVDTQIILREALNRQQTIMIEGTQGYKLGSHAGYYPFCTSGDCRASDFIAACGLPPGPAEVWVVLRTYPIRIAGDSGPMLKETTWEEIGVPAERTTVTKKIRRVAEWTEQWAKESVEANRGPHVDLKIALTFADYWWPGIAGANGDNGVAGVGMQDKLRQIEIKLGADIHMIGTGPDTQILIGEDD